MVDDQLFFGFGVQLRELGCDSLTFKLHYTMYTHKCLIYLLTANGLTAGGSSTVHIYTETISRIQNNTIKNFGCKAFWDSNPEWSN